MIAGLGALTVGGGAVFGSGAFSTVEAERQVEVEVVTGENIAENFPDIHLQGVSDIDSIRVQGSSESDYTTSEPYEFFPTGSSNSDTDVTSYNNVGQANADDISLVDNNVTIGFGVDGNELPPNSDVTYDNLFRVLYDGSETQDFNVDFSTNTDSDIDFPVESVQVGSDTANDGREVQNNLVLGTASGTDGGANSLTIEITEATP